MGRCFSFLNDYYGFGQGGDRKSSAKLLHLKDENDPKNQTELAQSYGVTKHTMQKLLMAGEIILRTMML